uniref:C2H2-type domain-containing protein n=1 Tax=Glossina austeni TaxID=7395 RepID=A0A1A9UD94_GLOAU
MVNFTCDFCGRTYKQKCSLNRHLRMHHQFNCLSCEVKFSSLKNFVKHQHSPITKPLKRIIKKLDNKNSIPLTSSFTNDSIENHNNGGDEGVDDANDNNDQHIN